MNIKTKQNIQTYDLKEIGLFFAVCFTILFNQVLHNTGTHPYKLNVLDLIRQRHSVELLKSGSGQIPGAYIQKFNGDKKFANYLAAYIKTKNKKIDTPLFIESLMSVSNHHAYDPVFLLAVIETESDFNFNAIGSAGEIGLMQIKPDTAEWICNKLNIKWRGADALKEPAYNILIGASYFKYLKTKFSSISLKYINAYNIGTTNLNRMPSAEVSKIPYYGKVIENYRQIYSQLKKIKEAKG